jgi:hypothetical protein
MAPRATIQSSIDEARVSMGELKRGEHIDVLAKVKGWEWVVVGKNGTGIGYVSVSMLSPADKYVP